VEPAEDRIEAHKGLISLPSAPENQVCADCHQGKDLFFTSLHSDIRGLVNPEKGVISKRLNPAKKDLFEKAAKNHCSSCHISGCGECHITRPKYNGGGFLEAHKVLKTPYAKMTCSGCHGARPDKEINGFGGNDFDGSKVDPKADVHWFPGGMTCVSCHEGSWAHSDQKKYSTRYEVENHAACEKCHDIKSLPENEMHKVHAESSSSKPLLQCQVCHAQEYNNCMNCHVGIDSENLPYYKTEKSWFDFKIGKNTMKSAKRPYDYVVVRHVPVSRTTFDYYGEDILSNFDAQPTWKYATPHSILKKTGRNGSCNSCHGQKKPFLLEENIFPDEKEANKTVIMDNAANPVNQ
jgi:thiosulfate/3-mercaptopyruvate sulfurtransferase